MHRIILKTCTLVLSVAVKQLCLFTVSSFGSACALLCFRNSDKGVEVAFLGTRTGLSRINLFVGPEQLTNQ